MGFQLFEYKRLVDVLLYTTTEMTDALFIQRIAIYLLNTLACQVDRAYKSLLGEAGAVPVSLNILFLGLCFGKIFFIENAFVDC